MPKHPDLIAVAREVETWIRQRCQAVPGHTLYAEKLAEAIAETERPVDMVGLANALLAGPKKGEAQ